MEEGETKTVTFDRTPIMSTYLVAVVVGEFDYVESKTSDGITGIMGTFSYSLLKLIICVSSSVATVYKYSCLSVLHNASIIYVSKPSFLFINNY